MKKYDVKEELKKPVITTDRDDNDVDKKEKHIPKKSKTQDDEDRLKREKREKESYRDKREDNKESRKHKEHDEDEEYSYEESKKSRKYDYDYDDHDEYESDDHRDYKTDLKTSRKYDYEEEEYSYKNNKKSRKYDYDDDHNYRRTKSKNNYSTAPRKNTKKKSEHVKKDKTFLFIAIVISIALPAAAYFIFDLTKASVALSIVCVALLDGLCLLANRLMNSGINMQGDD